jgi:hypothetical protein
MPKANVFLNTMDEKKPSNRGLIEKQQNNALMLFVAFFILYQLELYEFVKTQVKLYYFSHN